MVKNGRLGKMAVARLERGCCCFEGRQPGWRWLPGRGPKAERSSQSSVKEGRKSGEAKYVYLSLRL